MTQTGTFPNFPTWLVVSFFPFFLRLHKRTHRRGTWTPPVKLAICTSNLDKGRKEKLVTGFFPMKVFAMQLQYKDDFCLVFSHSIFTLSSSEAAFQRECLPTLYKLLIIQSKCQHREREDNHIRRKRQQNDHTVIVTLITMKRYVRLLSVFHRKEKNQAQRDGELEGCRYRTNEHIRPETPVDPWVVISFRSESIPHLFQSDLIAYVSLSSTNEHIWRALRMAVMITMSRSMVTLNYSSRNWIDLMNSQ